ncbi:MAG: bifunctional acetate--CoA ligase family protein/GNAT family N-acetyltransferase [Comamonas sp.]|nr:bifunctional acetate--CoA ligase family protein/GNAT family N-acetyltransferase [Comamonas sp.]
MDKHYLTPLFAPRSIIVLAQAKEASQAQTAYAQALHDVLCAQRFSGTLTFLDPQFTGTLSDLDQVKADLAIIALPQDEQLAALELVGRMGCPTAMILSHGVEAAHARQLHLAAVHAGVYLLGPNSLGIQRPSLQLNAGLTGPLAKDGSLALVSQSGALTASILDWAAGNGVGFSSVISLGPHTSMGLPEALDFLANDGRTQSIVVYMEGIQNARKFMSALRSAAIAKPVVVLKAGRRPASSAAALTHSAAIVGSDDVFDAVLRRAGAVRVRSFVGLFSAAKCLASRYRPANKRLAIIANGGGPGVLAADWASEIDLELGSLSPEAVATLAPQLPARASLTDLIDITEAAQPEHYRLAVEAALADPCIGGLLVMFSPRPGVDGAAVAEAVAEIKRRAAKPLLTCWMGDSSVEAGRAALRKAVIPTFRTPEAAVGAFGNIASFTQNQQLLQQTPPPLSALAKPDIAGARLVIETVLAERRNVLTEMESKTLLAAFHIPVTRTLLARNAHEAMMIATQQGFPVALKIDSPDIAHKSDVGGVALNLHNGEAVRNAFNDMMQRVKRIKPEARINGITVQNMARSRRGREICIGLVSDDPFGPVITFGAGGTMIELIQDRAMELPPLNQFLARRLMERSRVFDTLGEWRGASPVNMEALEQVLLRVSEMVCALPQLREMDINPLIVDETGAVAVDARMVVAEQGHNQLGQGKYGHLAILPYPARYEQLWPMRDGGEYLVRPIRPDDAQMLQNMVKSLSPQSRYFRFVSQLAELPPAMLARFTLIDYDREMALVAVQQERVVDEEGEIHVKERLLGVSRYVTNPDRSTCEFALVVADDMAGQGLGSRLMLSIMEVARDKGLEQIEGLVLSNNPNMLKLMRRLGFEIRPFPDDPEFRLVVHPL